jgi:two-component system response regulator MprA
MTPEMPSVRETDTMKATAMSENEPSPVATCRVAVIDDDRAIRDMLEIGLVQEHLTVRTARDGAAGLELVREWNPHCIVLDCMMPKLDGIAAIPLIHRLTEAPIIMLTALGDVRDRIAGIAAGADDYLCKPFDIAELTVRIRASLRRPHLLTVRCLRVADLEIDLETRMARRGERRIELSTREFDLVAALARRSGRVYTREELLGIVWGLDREVSLNSVDTYIHYVRVKIDAAGEVRLLQTVRGVGYTLREQ